MRRLVVAAVALVAAGVITTGPAVAAPPHGGAGAHPHHVHLGNGGCVDIDAVLFNPDSRGLHQGSNASGPDRGPFHGPCH